MRNSSRTRRLALLAFVLLMAEVVLVLVSWLLSAMLPDAGVRSLLSSDGVRFLLGRHASMLATPVLVWLLLGAMAWGCLAGSGLLRVRRPLQYRERMALRAVVVVVFLMVVVVCLLTAVPHAVLLSATGGLFPSPFSASVVPLLAFGGSLVAVVYGFLSGGYLHLADVYESLLHGIRQSAPLLLFYILLIQIYESLRYVFF